ncbi:ATP-binding protein [Streptomyces sp. NPDC102441]|uniref:ATP-binding protein n=1 Tax=Streptomyces sp. NPDC102441 TaxID=3366176 RepID=UPI0037FDD283
MTDSPSSPPGPQAVNGLPSQVPAVRRFQSVFAFPAAPEAISPVRHGLHKLLCASGLVGIADVVALAAQELMANAVTHGCRNFPSGTEVTMTASCDGQQVRLKVQDPSDEHPCVRPETGDEECGRGMLLIDAFADRWGVEASSAQGCGKAVWMELACVQTDGVVVS